MSYELSARQMRSAADVYDDVATGVGVHEVSVTCHSADDLGHEGLATFLTAVRSQLIEGHTALKDTATGAAGWLRRKATWYEGTDETVATLLQPPTLPTTFQPHYFVDGPVVPSTYGDQP